MQGVIGQNELLLLLVSEPAFHQRQIQIRVTAVNFIAHDGMAEMRQVDADLVFAAGARQDAEQRKPHLAPALSPRRTGGEGERFAVVVPVVPGKSFQNLELRLRCRPISAHTILDGDAAVFVFAQRRVNDSVVRA